MNYTQLTIRKFAEALNCINESDVYAVEITASSMGVYKYKTLIHEFPNTPDGIISAYTYFIRQLTEYLKEGGWNEPQEN